MLRLGRKLLLIGLLISGLFLPAIVPLVSSAEGNIFINSTSTSQVGQVVQSGGSMNLFLGNVMWSSDATNMYLFISTDNSKTISSGDFVYTPLISIANVKSTTSTTNYSDNNGGSWVVGYGWVNGTIPQNLAVGNYYVKAFDLSSISNGVVAVTDTYFTINSKTYDSTLNITPPAGSGGTAIQFTGANYPPNAPVTISYYNPTFGTWNLLTTTTANGTGNIVAASQAPDLEQSLGSGDNPQAFTQISYSASVDSITYASANYDEYERGLSRVGDSFATDGLYGNGTNLDTSVIVMPGDSLTIAGEWFYPGIVYIRWDSSQVVGTVTSSQWQNAQILGSTVAAANGTFQTTVTIPQAEAGDHYIQIEDSQTWMVVTIFLNTATLSVTPSDGPGGATVQFTGTRYPASTAVNITYLNPTFDSWDLWATVTSDSSGNISLSCQMPDLQYVYPQGDSEIANESAGAISFRTEINSSVWAYATYNEQYRGLKQVGSAIASGLYGNGTDLSSTVNVTPGSSIVISGQWFHPGIIYVRFDGEEVVGTVTASQWQSAEVIGTTAASQSGSFSTTVTIPNAEAGSHFIQVEDSQTWMVVTINVEGSTSPTPTPSPTPAPTATPSPSPTPVPVYTVTITQVGSGTVSPPDGQYPLASPITLTATPASNYAFMCWLLNGVTLSTSNPYVYTPTSNSVITAVFYDPSDKATPSPSPTPSPTSASISTSSPTASPTPTANPTASPTSSPAATQNASLTAPSPASAVPEFPCLAAVLMLMAVMSLGAMLALKKRRTTDKR